MGAAGAFIILLLVLLLMMMTIHVLGVDGRSSSNGCDGGRIFIHHNGNFIFLLLSVFESIAYTRCVCVGVCDTDRQAQLATHSSARTQGGS